MATQLTSLKALGYPTDYYSTKKLGSSSSSFNLSPLQQEYARAYSERPSSSDLYKQYRKDLGIQEQEDVVTGLNRSVLDLEGKIKAVEPNVNQRTQDFLVTEAQRKRTVDVEQQPLREQYLESMRRKEYEEASLSSKNRMLESMMQYAEAEYNRPLDLLKTMIGWEKEAKDSAASSFDFGDYFDGGTPTAEPKPEGKPSSKSLEEQSQILDSLLPQVTPQKVTQTPQKKTSSGAASRVAGMQKSSGLATSGVDLSKILTGAKNLVSNLFSSSKKK